MKLEFKASYDSEGDILTVYREDSNVKESIEVNEDLIIDVDSKKKLVSMELIDAYKFLHLLNNKISKKMLREINCATLEVKNYRNYVIIILIFEYNNEIITESLPAGCHCKVETLPG